MERLAVRPVDNGDDLRPVADLRATFDEIFEPGAAIEAGVDGFEAYEAAGAVFDLEPVMFLRYENYPAGCLCFYARNAMAGGLKRDLLARIMEHVGLSPDRLVSGD